MKIVVATTRFEKLEALHLPLVVVDGSVDLTAASYILQRYDEGHPYKTLRSEADVIKRLYSFCSKCGFNLSYRFSVQEHLTVGEIESLTAFYSTRLDTGKVVAQGTFNVRWSVTQRFIKFIWTFYQSRLNNPEKILASKIQFESMIASLKIHGKTPYANSKPDKTGLTEKLRVQLLDIINPLADNLLNPWKNEYVRWRNYCLFLTLILGGNRKGESLGLKLRDFNLVGSGKTRKYFQIRKSEHAGYPRKERPAVKTKERDVELGEELAEVFTYFITEVRSKLKGAKYSEYVFLSLFDHKPLSVQAPNDALNALIQKYPEYKGKLSPHRLRNTYFDILRDEIDTRHESEGPIAKQGIMAQLMEYAGGWASGSAMPARYAKGSIQRKVSEFNLSVQSRILGANKYNE